MNDVWSSFFAQIKQVVGEKHYAEAINAIKNSINPQYTANLILTKGFTHDKKKSLFLSNMLLNKLQSSDLITLRISWANRLNFFPKPPIGNSSEIKSIRSFLSIRGNPYSPFDLFKLGNADSSFVNSDSILNYLWQIGWHRGLNTQKIFAEISNPQTTGELTEARCESYRFLVYPLGLPRYSGQTEKESSIFNNDWINYVLDNEEEEDSSHANEVHQVTQGMENAEDKNNQLDVEIARNKNVYRLLMFGGPKALFASQVAAQELDEIYGGKGDFILTAMENEAVAKKMYPVLLKRLRDRAIKLYIRKFYEPVKWSNQLEREIPIQRTIYKKERTTQWIKSEFDTLEAKEIEYPMDKVYCLEKFIQLLSQPNTNLIECKTLIAKLSSLEKINIKLTYYKALFIYSGALLLHELFTANIIDPLSSSSVKKAIEIGISDPEKHGYNRILTNLAEALKKPKVKKGRFYPIDTFLHENSGLLFDIDYDKINQIAASGALLARVMSDLGKESGSEPSFIYCQVGNGSISLSLTSMLPFEFDLSQYNIYKTTSK